MAFFSTPVGQGLVTLGTAVIIAGVAAAWKMSGRMSRVEGKLELLIEMVGNVLDSNTNGMNRRQRRRTVKGDKGRE